MGFAGERDKTLMEPTLESIKGGGGSIKVGTTGTISHLMSKELGPIAEPVPRPESKTDEASSSCTTTGPIKNHHQKKGPDTLKRTKNNTSSQVQMLMADDNMSTGGTPVRRPKPVRKGAAGVVEIVDIKCGGSDRKWVSPITDRLKKLNFSKLSESVAS